MDPLSDLLASLEAHGRQAAQQEKLADAARRRKATDGKEVQRRSNSAMNVEEQTPDVATLADLGGLFESGLKNDPRIFFDQLRIEITSEPFTPPKDLGESPKILFDRLQREIASKPFSPPPDLAEPSTPPKLEDYTGLVKPMKLWERVIFRSGRYRRELARAEARFAEAQSAFRAVEDRRIGRLSKMQARQADRVRQRLIEAERDFRTAQTNWIARLSTLQADHAARVGQRCIALDGLERGFAAGDASAIATYFSMVLLRSPYPEELSMKFKVSYFPNVKGLIVDYELPSPGVRTSIRTIYEDVVNSITLRTIHEVIAADWASHVAIVIYNGYVPTTVPTTGPDTRPCLISVQVAKEDFAKLDLTRINKASCLQYLGATSGMARRKIRTARPAVDEQPEPDHEGGLVGDFADERRLEGSRDIYQLRDHGQFGSYPSHDDYSDESTP